MKPEMRAEADALFSAAQAAGADIPSRMLPAGVVEMDDNRTLILLGEATGFLYACGAHIPGYRRRLTPEEYLWVDQELHGGKRPVATGGARPGAGRKPADGKAGTRRQVVLDDATIEICRQAGNGELSAGIRAVAAAYRAGVIG